MKNIKSFYISKFKILGQEFHKTSIFTIISLINLRNEYQTINNSYCVFHLNNAGILDKSSRVKLAVYADGNNTQLSQVSGVYALIQSAEIKNSMGEVICNG